MRISDWSSDVCSSDLPVGRPAPRPPADQRPKKISVTAVDKLKADPYEFYAKHILRLVRRDPVDVDPSAADRGNALHAIMEAWVQKDGGRDPRLMIARAEQIGRAASRERVGQSESIWGVGGQIKKNKLN